jgi:GNAT superfamily N-acetyltransferase
VPDVPTRARKATPARKEAVPVLVRRASIRDLEAVTALRLALLGEESGNPLFAHPHPDASRRALRLTRMQMATPGQVLLVATRRDDIVGVLRCREVRRTPLVTDSRQAIVTTAYVIPAERRSGVLRALLSAADRWCKQRNLSGMRLHCSLNNGTGRRAWESLGFAAAEVLYVRPIPAT